VTETFESIGGQPPFDQTVAGLQGHNSADLMTGGTGSFEGVSLNDVDTFSFHNQEILDLSYAGADPPPQGSFFETFNFGHGFENVYSDLAGAGTGGTDTVTDTFVTPLGNINVPTTFDATDALPAADFTNPSTTAAFAGDSFVPDPLTRSAVTALRTSIPTSSGRTARRTRSPIPSLRPWGTSASPPPSHQRRHCRRPSSFFRRVPLPPPTSRLL
jgi:hypothetical protein